jgi:hypothetical protein
MEYRSLTLDDRVAWARLLAEAFHRTPAQMEQLLAWFHDGFRLVTWGAWDGDRLVAQYTCRLLRLHVPGIAEPVLAGMGLNMAVDAAYRGQGLLDAVATPVHEQITELGCVAGVGFSSAGGLAVTRRSRSYRYEVLGPMTSSLVVPWKRHLPTPLDLTDVWPADWVYDTAGGDPWFIRYEGTTASIRHRFSEHPFRRYSFGVWRDDNVIRGLVVFRRTRLRGLPGVGLLAAYGDDVPQLLARWAAAIRRRRIPFVHVVTAPASPLREALEAMGIRVTIPLSRDPYHVIVRAVRDDMPSILLDLARWDCVGGDIL